MNVNQLSCQADAPSDYEELLNWVDLAVRAMRNPKLSPAYFRLLLSLLDTYPQILRGERVPVEVWRVQENAGDAKKQVTTNFFNDMNAIGAFVYESVFRKKLNDRVCFVTATPNTPYPETFDTANLDRKRRAKEKEAQRRNQFQDPRKQFECENCGSHDLEYEATAICKSCGHRHRTIEHIPASEIIIQAEVIEITDDWLDEPTEQRPVVQVAKVQVQQAELPAAAPAPALPAHLRTRPCPDCGKPNPWVPMSTAWGEPLFVCKYCSEEDL